jgi:hypothetical protein
VRIPTNLDEREGFYEELITKCLSSRQDRIANYDRLRSYFLFGSGPDSNPSAYNKIGPHLDQLTSFLFASDTTRFSIELGASVSKGAPDHGRTPVLVERLNNKWQDSGADIVFYNGVKWSLVYDSMLMKLIQRDKDTYPFLIEPHNFGVLREDVTKLDEQEAFVHIYFTTKEQLERDLIAHPKGKIIAMRVTASQKTQDRTQMPAGVQRIITSQFTPNMIGNVQAPLGYTGSTYRPQTSEELIEMRELWAWNDEENDYQIATMASGGICVYDRPNFFYPGESNFIQIAPNPAPDYFWGHSEVEKLTGLQDMRTHRLEQLNKLLDIHVRPPTGLMGWNGMLDEKAYALFTEGGVLSNDQPGSKIERYYPTIPSDTFAEIREIDRMFDEASAMSNVLSGRGETGVRSKGHAAELARLGSSRPKQRALIIEDSLEKVATLYLKLDQQHDDTPLHDSHDQKFISEQFTKDYTVKVDAHSSSPVFMEDMRAIAFDLAKMKAIGRASLLRLVRPPMLQELLIDLEKMEKAEAAQAAAQLEVEQQKTVAKGGGKLQAV